MIKNVKLVELNVSITTVFLKSFKVDLTEYNCLFCNKIYRHKFNEKLNEQFFNAYKFSDHDKNNFILFLKKKRSILLNIWIIGRHLMKHVYLKNKIFIVT